MANSGGWVAEFGVVLAWGVLVGLLGAWGARFVTSFGAWFGANFDKILAGGEGDFGANFAGGAIFAGSTNFAGGAIFALFFCGAIFAKASSNSNLPSLSRNFGATFSRSTSNSNLAHFSRQIRAKISHNQSPNSPQNPLKILNLAQKITQIRICRAWRMKNSHIFHAIVAARTRAASPRAARIRAARAIATLTALAIFAPAIALAAGKPLVITDITLAPTELTLRFNRAPTASEIGFFTKNAGNFTKTYTLRASYAAAAKLKDGALVFENAFCDRIEVRQKRGAASSRGAKIAGDSVVTITFTNAFAVQVRGLTNGASMRFWLYEPPRVAATIVVDAGHGGKDGGTSGGGLLEKDIALKVALKAGAKLQKLGYRVIYTRDTDVFLGLDKRAKIANQQDADIFVSIHVNAVAQKRRKPVANGIETYFLSRKDSARSKAAVNLENKDYAKALDRAMKNNLFGLFSHEKIVASNKLAIDVQREMLFWARKFRSSVADGGVREGPFYVLASVNVPAVLIELGYITNPAERKLLGNAKYLENLATGIAAGVDEYFKKIQQ